jgi:hypothetical protein
MIIKDELYGTIEVSELESKIIDTKDFQRMHRIKQMAFTYLVYPGATHTRFEHCLGTMALASMMCERLAIDREEKQKIRLYALLHDIGHVAFSHESEHVLKKYVGDHEEIGKRKIDEGEIADVLKQQYSPKEISGIEKSALGKIITSDLGADRMDYLKRDAQNTGVAYGAIDVDRILHTLAINGNELYIEERGLEAAESLLIARFMMFSTVYLHKTVRIAAAMLREAIANSIEDGTVKPAEFLSMGDDESLLAMQKSKNAQSYVDALLHRRLYKEAFSFETNDRTMKNPEKAGIELKEKCGCDVIVDYPMEISKQVDFNVKTERGMVSIMQLSEFIPALRANAEKRKKIIVLCPVAEREKVSKVAKKYFTSQ